MFPLAVTTTRCGVVAGFLLLLFETQPLSTLELVGGIVTIFCPATGCHSCCDTQVEYQCTGLPECDNSFYLCEQVNIYPQGTCLHDLNDNAPAGQLDNMCWDAAGDCNYHEGCSCWQP
jgi:hypothetical protein